MAVETKATHVQSRAVSKQRLAHPSTVDFDRINWLYLTTIIVYHLTACLAFVPWFFSWTGVVACAIGLYVFGTIGINLCYHRLLTHQGFTVAPWLERCFAVFGVCCVQDSPLHWVAVHRRHHQHPDDQPDPHSPFVNFFWGHVGWLLVRNTDLERLSLYTRYARHLAEDRFYLRFERIEWYGGVVLASWLAFYLAGFSAGWLIEQTFAGASQFALSVLIWGVFVRTVLVWHITWSVNSVTHLWGYRRYATGDGSRNNILIGLISSGEGWHNNHHADPRTAKNGRRWWEFDLTYLTIRALAATGLVSGVILPNPRIAEIEE